MNQPLTAEYIDRTKTYIRNEFNQYSHFEYMESIGSKEFKKRKEFIDQVLEFIGKSGDVGQEVKQQIIEIYIDGKSFKDISKKYDVKVPTIQKRINTALVHYIRENN